MRPRFSEAVRPLGSVGGCPVHAKANRSRRAEERPRPFEHGDQLRFFGGRRAGAARMVDDGAPDLGLQAWLASVEHQHRVERRRVERRRDAAADDHRARRGIVGEADVVGERHPDQHRGVGQHPVNTVAVAVVAAVGVEERIAGIALEALPGVDRRHGAGAAGVAGQACPPVAAEGFVLEEMTPGFDGRPQVFVFACIHSRAQPDGQDQARQHGGQARAHPLSACQLLHLPLLDDVARLGASPQGSHRRHGTVMKEWSTESKR